jgi:dTMP kinase
MLLANFMKNMKTNNKPILISQRPLFIVFEGIDGSGKSTLSKKLFSYLQTHNTPCILTKEPGATALKMPLYEQLHILSHYEHKEKIQYLLFAAERALHIETIIQPALLQGKIVISDRFIDSSRVYQKEAGSKFINMIFEHTNNNITPDITIFCEIDPIIALKRITLRGKDLMDKLYEKKLSILTERYKSLYKQNNSKNIIINCNTENQDEIFNQLLYILKKQFQDK